MEPIMVVPGRMEPCRTGRLGNAETPDPMLPIIPFPLKPPPTLNCPGPTRPPCPPIAEAGAGARRAEARARRRRRIMAWRTGARRGGCGQVCVVCGGYVERG